MTESPAIDGDLFRQVLGSYPTGVTLVTADDDGPCGMVIGSFGSVSLEPPLVQFMPGKTSTTWERIERAGAYCVNVMGIDQLPTCNAFFEKSIDPFEQVDWRPGVTGSPVIADVLAHVDCEIEAVHEAGDHYIVVGRVVDLATGSSDDSPLLFFRGGYGRYTPLAAG